MADPVKLDHLELTVDEVRMLYTASFYLTNHEQPLPAGHPPTPAMTAQLKLADALGEEIPEASLQHVQRAIDSARDRAERLTQQRQAAQSQQAPTSDATVQVQPVSEPIPGSGGDAGGA